MAARQQQQRVVRESNQEGRRGYRLAGKNLFLTWPQNDATKEHVLEQLLEMFGDKVEFAIVAKERHQDGEPHLHAVLALKRRVDWVVRVGHRLDQVTGKRGNYQAARSLLDVVKYVSKDGDFIEHGVDVATFLEAAKSKKNTKTAVVAKGLMDGMTVADLNEQYPGFVMMNLQKILTYQAHLISWSQTPARTWEPLTVTTDMSDPLLRLAGWLNANLGVERQLRQKQLLLSSEPGMGKTWLIEKQIAECFKVFKHPAGKWFDGFDTSIHDVMVFDEFVCGVQASLMNKVVDGSVQLLEVKGGTIHKIRNIPVIVLTNLTVDEMYIQARPAVRRAFLDRFEYIRLNDDEKVWHAFGIQDWGEEGPEDELSQPSDEDTTPLVQREEALADFFGSMWPSSPDNGTY